jgi:ActR/RegA family two-component response regulator
MSTIEDLLASDPSLLLVDDDAAFLSRLERAMARRLNKHRSTLQRILANRAPR